MKYLIIHFKNKTSLYTFSKILKNFNIYHSIINTPNSISRSCSLSIKTDIFYKNTIINALESSRINDFAGIFIVERQGFNERIQRLYWLY